MGLWEIISKIQQTLPIISCTFWESLPGSPVAEGNDRHFLICLSFFSIAVTKQHGQENLKKEVFTWACSFSVRVRDGRAKAEQLDFLKPQSLS